MNLWFYKSSKSYRHGSVGSHSFWMGLGLLIFAVSVCNANPPQLATLAATASAMPTPSETVTLSPAPILVPTALPDATQTPSSTPVSDFPNWDLFSSLKPGQYLLYKYGDHPLKVFSIDSQIEVEFELPPQRMTFSTLAKLSPNHQKLALMNNQYGPGKNGTGTLSIVDLENGEEQFLMDETDCDSAAWFPDSTLLAVSCNSHVYLFLISTGEKKTLPIECRGLSCGNLMWSPDGKWITYQTSNQMNLSKKGLFLAGISCLVPSGNCSTSNLGKINPLDYPMPYTWSPDGKYIVVAGRWDLSASREGIGLDFIDIQTRQVQRSIEIPGFNLGQCLSLAWSPDGKWIAFDQEDGIYKVPVEGGTPVLVAHVSSPFIIQWIEIS